MLPASREWFNGEKVECSINNKRFASYDKSTLVTAGKLKSSDGVYGIRFAHNTEAFVTGLKITNLSFTRIENRR